MDVVAPSVARDGIMSRAAARRLVLRRLIEQGDVASQDGFVEKLARAGHVVTQTTVSRDLAALGARRVMAGQRPRYVIEEHASPWGESVSALVDLMRTFVVRIDHSGNLVVIKTMPAAAHPVAAAIDAVIDGGAGGADAAADDGAPVSLESKLRDSIVATVAGDDTVLVVARAADGGAHAARHFEDIVENYA